MYTVTRTKPDGTTKTDEVHKLREAGQRIAWYLADNGYTDRKTATQVAMSAERDGYAEHNGFSFRIVKA